MAVGETQQFIYYLLPGARPELATDPQAWTEEDQRIGTKHFAYPQAGVAQGTVVTAGRSPDGVSPAVMILDAASEDEARLFMESDRFVAPGLFGACLHPFRIALRREPRAGGRTAR